MFPKTLFPTVAIVSSLALACTEQCEGAALPQAESISALTPIPKWVKQINALEAGEKTLPPNRGTIYLLVDRQANPDRNAFYYHEVRKIVSENGVQNSGSISVSFEPGFEKLVFHSVQLIRNGIASNRFDRSRITISPREKDSERSVYDSSHSAQLILEDVRPGDIIEFAYTVEGANPLDRGKYSSVFSMPWDAPVLQNSLRLIYSAKRQLFFKAANGAAAPKVVTKNAVTEAWSETRNVPARAVEDDVPDGHRPLQRVTATEFKSWAELAQWAMPLFKIETSHSPEFQTEVEKLRAKIDPENRVLAALQFVQEDIRSVAVATWVNSRSLTAPDEILRRRFANHFDKAILLVALLRALDIDAAPALVSDSYRAALKDQLPSPDFLNHVIVQVRLGSAIHWIDPWRDAQRGPLSQIYVARMGYALVLREEATGLTAFHAPPGSLPFRRVTENYRVPPPNDTADLEVVTEYRGLSADRTRASFREKTREEIQKQLLQYYKRRYPETQVSKLLWYEELPGQDACRVTEGYRIPHIWQLDEQNHRYTLSVEPGDIYSALGSEVSLEREDPFGLSFPLTVEEEMNFEMFEPWSIDANKQQTDTEFFKLVDEPVTDGAHVQFNYTIKMLKDRVEVNELSKFNDVIQKAKNSLGYTLKYSTPAQLVKKRPPTTFNWAVGAAALCFVGVAAFAAWYYFRHTKLMAPLPPPVNATAALNGIGGWLILVAIGHLLQPLGFIKTVWLLLQTTMDTNSWRTLTDPIESTFNAWWAPTLLFEMFFNLGALICCALLVALFFAKRFAWRRLFVFFLIAYIAGGVIDALMASRIPDAASSARDNREIVAAALAAAIWIPYVYRSKRVKATFRY